MKIRKPKELQGPRGPHPRRGQQEYPRRRLREEQLEEKGASGHSQKEGYSQREGKSAASRAESGKGLLDKAVGRENLSIKFRSRELGWHLQWEGLGAEVRIHFFSSFIRQFIKAICVCWEIF